MFKKLNTSKNEKIYLKKYWNKYLNKNYKNRKLHKKYIVYSKTKIFKQLIKLPNIRSPKIRKNIQLEVLIENFKKYHLEK